MLACIADQFVYTRFKQLRFVYLSIEQFQWYDIGLSTCVYFEPNFGSLVTLCQLYICKGSVLFLFMFYGSYKEIIILRIFLYIIDPLFYSAGFSGSPFPAFFLDKAFLSVLRLILHVL